MKTSRISYLEFYTQLNFLGVFSVADIRKTYSSFDSRRLFEWQKKGYIKKITNKWYLFCSLEKKEPFLWWISNRVRQPSYISFETALAYYGFIPEGVFAITAVTTKKPTLINFENTAFIYHKIKPSLFFGYDVIRYNNWPIKFADPNKVLLDYLYLNSHIKTLEDIEALRFNKGQILSQIDFKIMTDYLYLFSSKALNLRYQNLMSYLNV